MKKIDFSLKNNEYSIYINKDSIYDLVNIIKKTGKYNKIVIISDENVGDIYLNKVVDILKKGNFLTYNILIKSGEENKNLSTVNEIYNKLIENHITRTDLIITLGGGIVGDMGGFVASTYLRGIDFINIPTSLLAMVDSSIGGKVGVNLEQGKNLVGSFYHPKAVVVDINFLKTLPINNFSEGISEIIKYGLIYDEKLINTLEKYDLDTIIDKVEDIIRRCIEIKCEVVLKDEKESSLRMILNFGHTLAHGIEVYYNYEKYSHGEAVAIGMCEILKISEEKGLCKKGLTSTVSSLVEKYNLPTRDKNINSDELLQNLLKDKKARNDVLNVVIVEDIGRVYIKKVTLDFFK